MKTCYVCKGPIQNTAIEYMARTRQGYVLVRNVAVERCTQCGEVYLDELASNKIDAALKNAQDSNEHLEIPVVTAG